MIDDKYIEVKILIKLDTWIKKDIKNDMLDFLKRFEIIKLEFEEKEAK